MTVDDLDQKRSSPYKQLNVAFADGSYVCMKPIYKHLIITIALSVGAGLLATALIVSSENGYAAGFVFFPLFTLIGLSTLILLAAGVAFMAMGRNVGGWLLLAALLLPVSFIGSAFMAKQLEVGAYREEPMVPLTPAISNIVLLKEGVTNDEINEFWDETLSTKREDGRGNDHLPGLRGITRLPPRDVHEAVEFSFFDTATDEQREYVYSRVRPSPVVFKLLENVPTKDYLSTPDLPSNDNRPKKVMTTSNIRRIE